jgi:glyoxylase-like metal-dependent hydrolase (beta-lactamase superfamily II)
VVSTPRMLGRRAFLADLGHGAVAIALFSVAGCAPGVVTSPSAAAASSGAGSPGPTGARSLPPAPSSPPASDPPASGAGGGIDWARVNLGFVSAYVLVRNGEAALVDTGVAGSAGDIEAALTTLGLGWPAVRHVVVTHHHNDHAGSIRTVLTNAPEAAAYAGAEDLPRIDQLRPITAVGDGDTVFDLEIIKTPGHTSGSISVLDPVGGILVAGDALRTDGGLPALPGEQFTQNMELAKQSVVKLGALTYEILLVGHGEPIGSGASELVATLGAAA